MFGYVRPLKGELKIKEYELYTSAYCGLCHVLRKNYGPVSTFCLNYDFTLLALMLTGLSGKLSFENRRCVWNPLKKKCACALTDAGDTAAAATVILFEGKLRDELADNGFFKSLPARGARLLLKRAYKKAKRRLPDFAEGTVLRLDKLSALERAGCGSLDEPADVFASLLAGVSSSEGDEQRRRCLDRLFYHLGRWAYIIDACDDFERDAEKGDYNPLFGRFGKNLSPEEKQYLKGTLYASSQAAAAAADLLDFGEAKPIVENVLTLGMPAAAEAVLNGKWRKKSGER